MNILFATNSLVYATVGGEWNVESQFERMAQEGGQTVTATYSRIGGGTVEDHWNDDFRINARDELATGAYDLFVINGSGADDPNFANYIGQFENLATANGTETMILGIWTGDWQISVADPDSEVTAQYNLHHGTALLHGTAYAPTDFAYRDAYLALHDRYGGGDNGETVEDLLTADSVHGTHLLNFLAASILYSTIFNEQAPTSWRPPGVSQSDANLISGIVWDNVQQYAIHPDLGGGGDPNAPPILTAPGAASIDENTTEVLTATATDADGDSLTYSITGGADATAFTIGASSGVLSFVNPPDFENPTDGGANNVYNVRIAVSDGRGGSDDQFIQVSVQDVAEGGNTDPVADDGTASGDEDTVIGGTATGSDGDGDSLTYSLAGQASNGTAVVNSNGTFTYTPNPDFFGADSFGFAVDDGNGGTDTGTINVTVDPVNDDPSITSANSASVPENTTAVITVTSSDIDGGAPLYAIAGGVDAALFQIDPNSGALSFALPPDFEAPGDAGADNTYNVDISVSDGAGGSDLQSVTVDVTDVAESSNEAPVADDGNAAGPEDSAIGGTATASDGDGDPLTYSLFAQASNGTAIVAPGGAYSYTPDDNFFGADSFQFLVDDGNGGTDTGTINVTVSAVADDPVIQSGAAFSMPENSTAAGTVQATDADGDTLGYTISGGADAALFQIGSASGALSFVAPPDFEAPGDADGDNAYQVEVTVDDGTGRSDVQSITVSVTDVVEGGAPPPNSYSGRFFTDVNGNDLEDAGDTGVGGALVYLYRGVSQVDVTTTAADGSYIFTDLAPGWYSVQFVPPSGAEFVAGNVGDDDSIDSDVRTVTAEGYGRTSKSRLNDGEVITDSDAGITGGDPGGNTAPVLTLPAGVDVAENTTAVATASASDADGDTPVFAISGGADAALFQINATTGAISFLTAPDFEAPGDAGGNNVYDLDISVSDGQGGVDIGSIAVTVTDVPEGPGPAIGSISGRFFSDLNGNAIDDGGDAPVAGATVLLYRGVSQVDQTTTAADGTYSFTGLGTGWYSTYFVPPTGADFVDANAGDDDSVDSDVWAVTAEGYGRTTKSRLDGTNFIEDLDAGLDGWIL